MEACTRYATSAFISGVIWNFLPLGPFRSWVYWIGSFKHRMDLRSAARYLLPIFKKRMAKRPIPGTKPVDAIQWMIDMPPTSPLEVDARRHAYRILHLTFAGTGTSISLTQHLIWQILMFPEYLAPLREEIEGALAEHGGWVSDRALSHMRLLDSFIRETLRLNPAGVFGGARTVMQESYTFHDGLTLAPGTRIAFAVLSANLDPDIYDNSEKFKGFRFAGLEASSESQARVSAATIDENFLSFGYGRQACPGRFFAIRLVKLIFGRLIYEYDIRWAKSITARPKGMVIEGMMTPNMDTEILLRHRAKTAERLAWLQCMMEFSPNTVCDLILQQTQRHSDNIAISHNGVLLSYTDLDLISSRIALALQQKGVGPQDTVPILTTRCSEMITSILAVLKVGACYVPIDLETWSLDRIKTILSLVAAKTVIVTESTEVKYHNAFTREDIQAAMSSTEFLAAEPRVGPSSTQPEDPAYIIFTSGTTAVPKGVMVPHKALLNYVQQGGDETPFNMNVTAQDRVLLLFSIAFDACTGVIFSTLCNGGTLVVSESSKFTSDVRGCSILPATPSILNTLQEPDSYGNIRAIYLGGESPSRNLIQQWHSPCRKIFNCYGPTETTCASMIAKLSPDLPITLGRPMANGQVYLLDSSLEVSMEGEICISGVGLALGYFQNEELTKQKFITWNGTRIYRTGDFARQTTHGLEFLGRQDSLVKNRGFLINLESQVVSALRDYPGVQAATAFIHRDRLVAFLSPVGLDLQAMREKLSLTHDSFLVPDQIRTVDAFPLSTNGKVDIRRLRDLLEHELAAVENSQSNNEGSKLNILRSALSIILGLPLQAIQSRSTFWELGGNSLTAIQLVSHLHKQHLTIPFSQLFKLTLDELSAAIESVTPLTCAVNLADCIPSPTEESPSTPERKVPMTSVQMNMIRSSVRNPVTNYMLVAMAFEHKSKQLDHERLRGAWLTVLSRHSIFRTVFDLEEGLQQVTSHLPFDWQIKSTEIEGWEATVYREAQTMYDQVESRHQDSPYMPSNSFRLITAFNQKTTLLWLVHHSQVDGWSMSVLFKELQAVLDGERLLDVPQFSDFALAQQLHVRRVQDVGQQFWAQTMDGYLPVVPLRLPKPEPSLVTGSPSEVGISLSLSSSQLERRAHILGVSPAVIIYAAWAVLLSTYTSRARVVFGTVFSGRNFPMPSANQIVGPFINTCPLVFNMNATSNKMKALLDLEVKLLEINDHQWSSAPFLEDVSTRNQADMFNTVVAMEYDIPEISLISDTVPGPMKLSRKDVPEFGLTALIESGDDGLRLGFVYDNSLYEASTMKRMLKHFRNIFRAFLDPRCLTIESIHDRMIGPAEFLSLTQTSPVFNEVYNGPANLKDAFEQAANQWSDLTAVESSTSSMTYKELDQISNRVANRLAAIIQRGDVVAVLSDGSLDWVIAFLAVIKAGAIYTPIDITLPSRRMQAIVEHGSVALCILLGHKSEEIFQVSSVATLSLRESLNTSNSIDAKRLPTTIESSDPAYLIFTSGSTGIPKGTLIRHEAILSYLSYPPARLHAGPGRRNAQMYSVGFDASIAEILGAICYGATLVLKDPEDPQAHLYRVNATMVTPSLLGNCSPEDFKNLDTIFLGGETVSQRLADSWSQGRRLYNAYGPCECAVGCLFAHLRPGEKVTLGHPIPRMAVYLLDARKRPVPVGVPGEICLSGIQVSEGYVELENETRDRFVPNPYLPGQSMYITGDLGIWTERMEIRFLGRTDNQVKVRGFRIELEEVERAIIEANMGVTHAAVIVQGDNLIGFVAPQNVDSALIRRNIRSLLPSYACPSVIVALTTLPTTPNQKIDRNALMQRTYIDSKNHSRPYTGTEKMLARIWGDIIYPKGNAEFSPLDDFMLVGGNSLRQIRVAQKIAENMGCKVPLGIIIKNTELSSLAGAIDEYTCENHSMHPLSKPFLAFGKVSRASAMKLSILEEEMYLLHTISNTRSMFNTVCHLEISGNLDLDCLSRAFNQVVTENEILRTRYVNLEGFLYRKISQEVSQTSRLNASTIVFNRLEQEINKSFNLADDQLIRAIFVTNTLSTSLIFIVHHMIADHASMASLLRRVQHKYIELLDRCGGQAPDVKDSAVPGLNYVDWAHWTREQQAKVIEPGLVRFWREYCRDVPRRPFSHHGISNGQDDGQTCAFLIPNPRDPRGSQVFYVAAVALTIRAVIGTNDLLLAIPYMDRYEPGTADLLGLCLDRLPIRIQLNDKDIPNANALLDSVRSMVQAALSSYVPYQVIRKVVGHSALFDIIVSYHRVEDSLENCFQLPGTSVVRHSARPKGAKFPLMFEFSETQSGTLCEIEYNTRLLDRSVIDAVQSTLLIVLEGLSQGRLPDGSASGLATQTEAQAGSSRVDPPVVSMDKTKIDVVRSVFAEVLSVDIESINYQTSFLDLGGSSVQCLRLHWLLRQRNVHISLRDILGGQSVERIAAAI